jgi:hypothetical protein
MIPKSGYRFSDKIMLQQKSMIPKSGYRFSDKIMLQQKSMIPKKPAPDLIRGGYRISEEIVLQLCHTAVTHFDDADGSYAGNWGAAMSNDPNARFHRINGEMLETIDEELELEIDDDRLASSSAKWPSIARRRPSSVTSTSRSCFACKASW